MWSRTMGPRPGDDSEGNKGRKKAKIYSADLAAGPWLFREKPPAPDTGVDRANCRPGPEDSSRCVLPAVGLVLFQPQPVF